MKYNLKTAVRIVSEEDRHDLIPFFEAIKSDCHALCVFKYELSEIQIGSIWYIWRDEILACDGDYVDLSDYTIIEGIPENWREEMEKEPETELQSKINQLESENKELREFLRISVDIIESFGNVEPYSLTEKELEYITQAKQLLNK